MSWNRWATAAATKTTDPGTTGRVSPPIETARPPSSPAPSASPTGSFDPTAAKVAVTVAVTGLTHPVEVANAGDGSGRLFVLEQAGRIRIVRDGALVERPFLDIRGRI